MSLMFPKKPIKSLLLGLSVLTVGMSQVSTAQQEYYDDRRSNAEPYISIFEDCDFKGARRDIAVGEFRNMRELDFGNDKMSSIQVPRELEAIIYQHDQFRGDYARVNRDVRCFDRDWNDEVSSLRVEYADGHSRNRNDRRNPVYGGDRNDRGDRNSYDNRREGSRDRYRTDRHNDGVSANTVAQVVFDNRVLKQIGDRKWQIADRRAGVSQYREIRRDKTQVFLKNEYNAERIKIDMITNTVTIFGPRGGQESYRISNRSARVGGFTPAPAPRAVTPAEPNRRINASCFNYFARTTGGSGGIRFVSKDGFHRFQEDGHRGRVCHNGNLVMEINKRDINSEVMVEIQGRIFRFAAGEKEDRLENKWYRKNITLKVGK